MKLYGFFRSSAAFRVRIALNLKGLDYEQASIHLRKNQQFGGDYLKLNPQALVPALEDDGASRAEPVAGDHRISRRDSAASRRCCRPTPIARARVRSIAQMIACDIHPIDNLRVLRYLARSAAAMTRRPWRPGSITGSGSASTRSSGGSRARRTPAGSATATRRASPIAAWCRRCERAAPQELRLRALSHDHAHLRHLPHGARDIAAAFPEKQPDAE